MVKYAPIALTGDMVVVITRDLTPSTWGQACQKQPIFITHLPSLSRTLLHEFDGILAVQMGTQYLCHYQLELLF